MEAYHEAGHYLKVKYDWIKVEADGSYTSHDFASEFFKDWNLIQIEGEDPVALQEAADAANAQVDAKGKPIPPKKKEEKKAAGGKGATMEEITDNRPRQVNYTNDFAENGIPAMRINEAVADKFT
jgi:hypothetical protein